MFLCLLLLHKVLWRKTALNLSCGGWEGMGRLRWVHGSSALFQQWQGVWCTRWVVRRGGRSEWLFAAFIRSFFLHRWCSVSYNFPVSPWIGQEQWPSLLQDHINRWHWNRSLFLYMLRLLSVELAPWPPTSFTSFVNLICSFCKEQYIQVQSLIEYDSIWSHL